ncbi:MAG: hypothetical protein KKH98_05115 [Spirochaetes bacterium]|nr:hypothetical protein [Spirochaetota bacterium]
MDKDIVIGCILIAGAIGFLTFIVLWSRRMINFICDKGPTSARKIIKELDK